MQEKDEQVDVQKDPVVAEEKTEETPEVEGHRFSNSAPGRASEPGLRADKSE